MELDDDSVIGRVAKTKKQIDIPDAGSDETFERMALAKEFGITRYRALPYMGLVLEYGVHESPG